MSITEINFIPLPNLSGWGLPHELGESEVGDVALRAGRLSLRWGLNEFHSLIYKTFKIKDL